MEHGCAGNDYILTANGRFVLWIAIEFRWTWIYKCINAYSFHYYQPPTLLIEHFEMMLMCLTFIHCSGRWYIPYVCLGYRVVIRYFLLNESVWKTKKKKLISKRSLSSYSSNRQQRFMKTGISAGRLNMSSREQILSRKSIDFVELRL